MEKICPQCQTPNPADGSFCRSCATPIALVQPTYSQPQWQQPPPYHWPQPPSNQQWQQQTPFGGPLETQMPRPFQPPPSNRPVIAICLVIAGLVCCSVFTMVPGSILGWLEMRAIKEGRAPESGLAMAQIAFWGGMIMSVLSIAGFFFALVTGILSEILKGI